MAEISDRDLAKLYYDRYQLLMLDQKIGVDDFEVLDDSDVAAMAGAIRHVMARVEQLEARS